MAKRAIYEDDITHEEIELDLVGGNPTVILEIDGERYALDAGLKTRDAIRKANQKFIDAARKPTEEDDPYYHLYTKRGRGKASGTSKPTGSGRSPEAMAAVREWANKNGHTVAAQGRIAQNVYDAYDAAH